MPAPRKDKSAPVLTVETPRQDAFRWGLLVVGVVVILLLAALLIVLLRKPPTSDRSAAAGTQQAAPQAQAPAASLAGKEQQNQAAATSNALGLAQGQQQNVPGAPGGASLAEGQAQKVPGAQGGAGLAQGQQENVPQATGSGDLAASEEESYDPAKVRSWQTVYWHKDSGNWSTPPLPLQRPWRIRYYTGTRPFSDIALDEFLVLQGGMLQAPLVSVYKPEVTDWRPSSKRGPVVLDVYTTFNDWLIYVDQGTF
ncbi:MAG TPA: hypothetical protein VGM19_07605 [Armatimonadota bacterium]|jgi:hypothetical protein